MANANDAPRDTAPAEPPVLRLAGPRRTSALGLAMLGLDEVLRGPLDQEVVLVRDDAGAPPDGKVRVVLGDDPAASRIRVGPVASSEATTGEK